MAQLSPEGAFDTLKDRVAESVSSYFPYEGKKRRLELNSVQVEDDKDVDDIRSQKKARLSNRSWTVPVMADVSLVDKASGKVIDRKKVKVANLPKITRRYSYIVDGNEWQVDNQFRLKSGVYHRRTEAGELESHWNAAKGQGFRMYFDPAKRSYRLKYGGASNIALYPVLKTMGVSDDELERAWGKQIFADNKAADSDQALKRFYKTVTGKAPENISDAQDLLRETFQNTELYKETTKRQLGKAKTSVDGDALLRSSRRLLEMSRGVGKGDDREALENKELFSVEDLLGKRITDSQRMVKARLGNNIDRKRSIRQIITPDIFNKPVKTFFTSTSLAHRPDQTNPLEFISGQTRTTVMGEGGISDIHRVTEETKLINPSHLGFLDPIQTPESGKVGINLNLALNTRKKGRNLVSRVFNTKKKKLEMVDPGTLQNSVVAYPDQVRWKGGRPVPVSKVVKVSDKGGELAEKPFSKVDYVLPSSKALFSTTANTIPFLNSASGNRASMATRQSEQAISLQHREAPLVQSKTESNVTYEEVLGAFNSHQTPVDGVVDRVKKDAIIIKKSDGKKVEVQTYHDFPLNSANSYLDSTPLVKKGDKVKRGQTIADTNFSRDGVFALGKNLRIGYLPMKGYNFEDGIVISETAADKLTSEHMHRKSFAADKNSVQNKNKFLANFPKGELTPIQRDKLDEDAVAQEGQTVEMGDVLIGGLRKRELTQEEKMLSRLSKAIVKPYRDSSITWDKEVPGEVVRVTKTGTRTQVFVKTKEKAKVGDKMVGRHANKGIITKVIPDHEMPHTADGIPIEVAYNPSGIPSRMNPSQILETAAAKIALKTGKPYVVDNFSPNVRNNVAKVRADLEAHGLTDKEELFDPETKKSLGQVMVGPQYTYKLHHQVDKKMSARAGGVGYPYDVNQVPKGGGDRGAKSLGSLGLYSMLAHGARANLREMMTYKGDRNDELWSAIQAGEPLPPPRPSFAYHKLEAYMKGMGVNVEKQGNSLNLIPMTDKDTRTMSAGALPDAAKLLRGKDLRPERGGLFDPLLTGGPGGSKWSHMELTEPMPNPLFEKAVLSLTGLKKKEFESVMAGEKEIDGVTSGAAIEKALSKIDVDAEIKATQELMPKLKDARLDRANKKLKYLKALKTAGLSPTDAYISKTIPVLPPVMRPVTVMDNGDLNYDDINGLYKDLSLANQKLKEVDPALPDESKNALRKTVYDGIKALTMTGGNINRRYHRGIMDAVVGDQPKTGFFQDKITARRQDLTLRSTIVPEPSLGLDEVGLPQKGAMETYKPFVVQYMHKQMGYDPLDAQKAIKANSPPAMRALERVMDERPVLLKRDPALHKFNIMAFKPKIVEGKTIKIHPLVTGGFNADFDGDQMNAYVPITKDAVAESYKMLPSNNLFNDTSGKVMHTPSQDAVLGLYDMTEMGKRTSKKFTSEQDVLKAHKNGDLQTTDVVRVGSKLTTPGRVQVAGKLPKLLTTREKVLYDPKFQLDKWNISSVFDEAARKSKGEFGRIADGMKDLGNEYAYLEGASIGLDDIEPFQMERDRALAAAKARLAKDTSKDKDQAARREYARAMDEIEKAVLPQIAKKNTALHRMMVSGAKGKKTQIMQVLAGPVLVKDPKNRVVPIPVSTGFAEGMSTSDYWTQMHGVRKGATGKVLSTQEPGSMTKNVINTTMNQLIKDDDCGTDRGVSMKTSDREILDRYLASPVKLRRGKVIPAGTLLTTDVVDRMSGSKVSKIQVRSPLKCEHGEGMCAKCYGLAGNGRKHEPGTNVGIIAAQAMGEPATQLALNTFHTGGAASAAEARGQVSADKFARVQHLLNMPKTLPGSAVLSTTTGTVGRVKKDPAGGFEVMIEGRRHFVPQDRGLLSGIKRGAKLKQGTPLSKGPINPHELLQETNIETVRNYLTDELYDAYKDSGPVKRRNFEVVVRSLTNITRVEDPGDSPDYVHGDSAPATQVAAWNRNNKKLKPVKHRPVLKGVAQVPEDLFEDWVARLQHKKLRGSLIDAANQGWTSDVHGMHPIPGIAYGAEFGQAKGKVLPGMEYKY